MTVQVFIYTLLHNTNRDHFLAGYQDGDRLVRGYTGAVETTFIEDASELVFAIHNRDDRPDGKTAPSVSVGDVVLLSEPDGDPDAFAVAPMGFEWVPLPENVETTKSYLEVLAEQKT